MTDWTINNTDDGAVIRQGTARILIERVFIETNGTTHCYIGDTVAAILGPAELTDEQRDRLVEITGALA